MTKTYGRRRRRQIEARYTPSKLPACEITTRSGLRTPRSNSQNRLKPSTILGRRSILSVFRDGPLKASGHASFTTDPDALKSRRTRMLSKVCDHTQTVTACPSEASRVAAFAQSSSLPPQPSLVVTKMILRAARRVERVA